MTDLLAAVDALTLAETVKLDELAGGRRIDPPLLDQLLAASGLSAEKGGGGKLASQRTPAGLDRISLILEIEDRLGMWLYDLGGTRNNLTLTQRLRVWYRLHIGGTDQDHDEERRIILERWATSIRDLLDGFIDLDYPNEPCPLCGETRATWKADGQTFIGPALRAILRPEYRYEGSYGFCRACEQVVARESDPLRLRARMNGADLPVYSTDTLIKDVTQ